MILAAMSWIRAAIAFLFLVLGVLGTPERYIIYPKPNLEEEQIETLKERIAAVAIPAASKQKVYAEVRYGQTRPQFFVAFLTESAYSQIREDDSVSSNICCWNKCALE